MKCRHGLSLLVFSALVFLGFDMGRHILVDQSVPTFFVEHRPEVQVALEGNWEGAGVYQISDGFRLSDVIKLTNLEVAPTLVEVLTQLKPVRSGESFILQVVGGSLTGFSQHWMSAQQRITLGIPLHPDRMTRDDWVCLPGVGQRIATVIDEDRQNNGDFLTLQSLERVKGIGQGKLQQWKEFF